MGQLNLSTYWVKGGAWLTQYVLSVQLAKKINRSTKALGLIFIFLLRNLRVSNPRFGYYVRMY